MISLIKFYIELFLMTKATKIAHKEYMKLTLISTEYKNKQIQ